MQSWPSKPDIWICAPSPILPNVAGISNKRKKMLEERKPILKNYITIIQKIAEEKQVGYIDLNTPLSSHPEYFLDGVHMYKSGYEAIAQIVHDTLKYNHKKSIIIPKEKR